MDSSSSSHDDPWADQAPREGPGVPSTKPEAEATGGSASEGALGCGIPLSAASSQQPVVAALQPPAERVTAGLVREAAAAQAAGLPVPVLPTDEPAEAVLKKRIAEAHLRLGGAHEAALRVLADVAEGKVTQHNMVRDGTVVELPVEIRTRVSAARALLDHAARITKTAAINVDQANILSVGDLITRVDPDQLRAAVDKLRSAQ